VDVSILIIIISVSSCIVLFEVLDWNSVSRTSLINFLSYNFCSHSE
jgi:hypothetical protein